MLVVMTLFYLVFPQKAYAYLDPGSGSFILQVILASLVGMLFAIKMFWKEVNIFLKNLFSRKNKHKKDEDE